MGTGPAPGCSIAWKGEGVTARASGIGRTSFVTFFFLGEAYRDNQRLDRAIPAYREATRLAPEFAQAWFELGAACTRTGEKEDVATALASLKNLDPALAAELKKRSETTKPVR